MTLKERFARRKFDSLFRLAERFIKKHNPCKIEIRDGVATCISSRTEPGRTKPGVLCCTGCEYHSAKGCTAEKPLTCKLWLCAEVKLSNEAWRERWDLIRIFRETDFYAFRGDKESSIREWKHYSEA